MKSKIFLIFWGVFFLGFSNFFALNAIDSPKMIQLLNEKKNIIESIIKKYKNTQVYEDEIPKIQIDLQEKEEIKKQNDYSLLEIQRMNSYYRDQTLNSLKKNSNFYKFFLKPNEMEVDKDNIIKAFRFLQNNNLFHLNKSMKSEQINVSLEQIPNKNSSIEKDEILAQNNRNLSISKKSDPEIEIAKAKMHLNFLKNGTSHTNESLKHSKTFENQNRLNISNFPDINQNRSIKIAELTQISKTFQNISTFKDFTDQLDEKTIKLMGNEKAKKIKNKILVSNSALLTNKTSPSPKKMNSIRRKTRNNFSNEDK